jgi:hypothetical protein
MSTTACASRGRFIFEERLIIQDHTPLTESVPVATFEEYALSGNVRFEHGVTIVADIHERVAGSAQRLLVLRNRGTSGTDRQVT